MSKGINDRNLNHGPSVLSIKATLRKKSCFGKHGFSFFTLDTDQSNKGLMVLVTVMVDLGAKIF